MMIIRCKEYRMKSNYTNRYKRDLEPNLLPVSREPGGQTVWFQGGPNLLRTVLRRPVCKPLWCLWRRLQGDNNINSFEKFGWSERQVCRQGWRRWSTRAGSGTRSASSVALARTPSELRASFQRCFKSQVRIPRWRPCSSGWKVHQSVCESVGLWRILT